MSLSSYLDASGIGRGLWPVLLIALISCCAAGQTMPASPATQASAAAPTPAAAANVWTKAAIPFKPVRLTAVGNVFWACGDDEMIASSSDGGSSWTLRHQNPSGATLLDSSFITEQIGYTAGTRGQLLSTTDGGATWKTSNAGGDIWAFSFADDRNGIAVIGGDRDGEPGPRGLPEVKGGRVKLTHDGGSHWEDIAVQDGAEMQPFPSILTVAALDASSYLMLRRQPQIEDVFFVTHDAGKSWHAVHQRNDATNRELARWVFVQGGEYWAFGMELLHRDSRGGYGAPLTMHSKDGESWVHGAIGSKEFEGCNPQGCYMWDGTVESLYGEHEQYWALPQDGSMTSVWARTQDRACTVGEFVECGPAAITEAPQPRPVRTSAAVQAGPDGIPSLSFRAGLPEGCAQCTLEPIPWKLQQRSVLFVEAKLTIGPAGDVKEVLLSQLLDLLGPSITQQLSQWQFQPSPSGAEAVRHVQLVIRCGFDNAVCELVSTVAAQ